MAVKTRTVDDTRKGQVLVTWTALAEGDSGSPVDISTFADRTVQFTGTFGGTTMTLEGSNDGTNWVGLQYGSTTTDAISCTSADMFNIYENPRYVRPLSTGGTGTAVVVTVFGTSSV